jgi:hypothetical protein
MGDAREILRSLATLPAFPTLTPTNVGTGFFERLDFDAMLSELPETVRPVVTFMYWTGWRRGTRSGSNHARRTCRSQVVGRACHPVRRRSLQLAHRTWCAKTRRRSLVSGAAAAAHRVTRDVQAVRGVALNGEGSRRGISGLHIEVRRRDLSLQQRIGRVFSVESRQCPLEPG